MNNPEAEVSIYPSLTKDSRVADLFSDYQKKLIHYFLKLTNGNLVESEDLVQIVFIKVLTHIDQFKASGSMQDWIFSIARNSGKDYYRKKNLVVWLEECQGHPVFDDSFDQINSDEQKEFLYLAFSKLKPRDREMITLSLFQSLTFRQIAAILGISEAAAKVRYHRAIKRLRMVYLDLS
jgi:RNA polymerase sigma factor (sigma-70 family)